MRLGSGSLAQSVPVGRGPGAGAAAIQGSAGRVHFQVKSALLAGFGSLRSLDWGPSFFTGGQSPPSSVATLRGSAPTSTGVVRGS